MIKSGLVGCNGRVKRTNTAFGEDVITGLRREYSATSLTHCCLMALEKDDMLKIIQQGEYEKIFKSAMRRARWMRLRFALLDVSRTRKSLLTNIHGKFEFVWENDEKQRLLVICDGQRMSCRVRADAAMPLFRSAPRRSVAAQQWALGFGFGFGFGFVLLQPSNLRVVPSRGERPTSPHHDAHGLILLKSVACICVRLCRCVCSTSAC